MSDLLCVQLVSYLEGGSLMWMMPLHLHVKSDYDDMINTTATTSKNKDWDKKSSNITTDNSRFKLWSHERLFCESIIMFFSGTWYLWYMYTTDGASLK